MSETTIESGRRIQLLRFAELVMRDARTREEMKPEERVEMEALLKQLGGNKLELVKEAEQVIKRSY